MKSYRVLAFLFAMMLLLSSCNLPGARATQQSNPNAVFTAAAQTVEVQLTQNALLNPISPPATIAPPVAEQPPLVADTPQVPAATAVVGTLPATLAPAQNVAPTSVCDAAQFISDVTIPDGSPFAVSATFTKIWRLKNVGTCTWNSSYALVFDSGDAMAGARSLPLPGTTAPGAALDVSINLQAPAKDGVYRGFWGLTNASGVRIPVVSGTNGNSFYVDIKVGTGAGSDGTIVPGTESAGKFAVMSVGFSALRSEVCSSATGKYIVNATITVNKAGNVNYTWVRSDGVTTADMSGTLLFDSSGSKTVSYEWVTTVSGLWVDLYIDKPNHQQFGRVNLSCP
ncbi:MAG: NBR1-Ig-like domain-containing protein [Chloroflexi bacterium]|nr:NBR1-Ig-like domain-containing protein [Chloroflexota bacterium]